MIIDEQDILMMREKQDQWEDIFKHIDLSENIDEAIQEQEF